MQRGEDVGAPPAVMVLGVSGLLGHVVLDRLSARGWTVTGVMRRRVEHVAWWPPFGDPAENVHLIGGIDAQDWSVVERLLDRFTPHAVVNCIGVTPRRADATDEIAAIRVNSLLPHLLARWAEVADRRLINISTDCVFGHEPGGFTERSATDATDLYGQSKALGEVVTGRAVTIRTSFVGRELCNRTELLDWFLGHAGGAVSGYTDVWYSGVPVEMVAEVIELLVDERSDITGLRHLASVEPFSKYDLLRAANEAFSANVAIEPDASVTSHRTLNGSRLRDELRLPDVDWSTAFDRLAGDRRYDLRPDERVAS